MAKMILCAVMLAAVAGSAWAAELKERWLYLSADLSNVERLDDTIGLLKKAKEAGCTHVQLNDGMMARLDEAEPAYFEAVKKVLDAAKELDIEVIPGIFNIGYSGRYLRRDPNLAAGIPVKEAPFFIKEGVAAPDPANAPALAAGEFDEAKDNRFAGWTKQDYPGVHSFADAEVKHSGTASLKVTNLDKLPPEADEQVRVGQTLKVRPFQNYRLTVWVKTDNIQAEREDYVLIFSGNRTRRNCYANLRVRETQDWTEHSITFNSLEAEELEFSVGVTLAKGGTVWFDGLKIEPAGLADMVFRELCPLKVTSADGKVVYEDGKDYELVTTTLEQEEGRGRMGTRVERKVAVKDAGRIKEGDKVLMSFYHTARIYDSQLVCSLEDPKILQIMDDQMRLMAEHWPTPGYFMAYDEIRIGGWELQQGGAKLTCAQLLAQHVSKAVGMVEKYAPGARVYVWSDMFDPTHNARPFERRNGYYYLCNGNWDGSWEGLPKEVIIMNWNGTENAAESMRWFAGRGHLQIMAGYYDGDSAENIDRWLKAAEGVPNVIGMMYTTWRRNYDDLPGFFKLLDERLAGAQQPAAGGQTEKEQK